MPKHARKDNNPPLGNEDDSSKAEKEGENARKKRPKLCPTKANPEITSKISMLNPMGQALHRTLESHDITENNEDGEMQQYILEAYQNAMVEELDNLMTNKSAPAAIMRGTIAHYNRFGGQWRISVNMEKNENNVPASLVSRPELNEVIVPDGDGRGKGRIVRRGLFDGLNASLKGASRKGGEKVENILTQFPSCKALDILIFDDA